MTQTIEFSFKLDLRLTIFNYLIYGFYVKLGLCLYSFRKNFAIRIRYHLV